MATADEYAAWIVKNSAKRGTPEFDTVAKAYELAKGEETTATFKQQNAPLQQQPSVMDQIVGAGETALTLGTGAVGGTLGTLAGTLQGLSQQILSGQFGTPEAMRAVEKAATEGAQALTYQPRTQAGQEQVQAVGQVLANVLPPVLPMIAAPGALTQAARSAAPITQATAQRGAAAVQQAASASGHHSRARDLGHGNPSRDRPSRHSQGICRCSSHTRGFASHHDGRNAARACHSHQRRGHQRCPATGL